MDKKFTYLVYDIESVTDKALLNRVLYAPEDLEDEAAFTKHLKELAELENGRDFINPAFHQPVSLAALAVADDFSLTKIGLLGGETRTTEDIVLDFWTINKKSKPVLVDFNGKGFDLRLLELWAFRLGITIGAEHFGKFGPRYKFADEKHLDLNDFMSNFGAIRYRGGLNLLAKLLNKPGKMETSGNKVQALYDAGKQFEIDDYCLCDAMDTYFVFLRTRVMTGQVTLDSEKNLQKKAVELIQESHQKDGYFASYLKSLSL